MHPAIRRFAPALALAILPLAAYWPALHGGFVWDDRMIYIADNALLRLPDGIFRFWFTTQVHDYYIPLTYTSFWVEFRLWGLDTLGYHLVNVALHAGTSVLLWRLCRAFGLPAAWLTAAIFALHPVNVESVAWIAERKTLLGAFFGLAAWLCYMRSEEQHSGAHLNAAVALFFLSLTGKPVLITLPLLLLAWRWWARRPTTRRDLFRLAPFFALSLFMGAVGIWFNYTRALAGHVTRPESAPARIAAAGSAACFYIFKALVPSNLSFVYPRWTIDAASLRAYLPDVLLALLLCIAWRLRERWGRPVLAGLGGFMLSMLPVLGLVDVYYWQYSLVGDHYQYQSIAFIIALVVAAAHRVLKPPQTAAALPRLIRVTLPSVVVLAALFALTWRQSGIYISEESIWRDTLAKNPGAWLAHTNLGNIEFHRKNFAEAIPHYHASLSVRPDDPLDHLNLAAALTALGRDREAVDHWREALRLNPDIRSARRWLAIAYEKLNRLESARATWEEILARDPKNEEARSAIDRLTFANPSAVPVP